MVPKRLKIAFSLLGLTASDSKTLNPNPAATPTIQGGVFTHYAAFNFDLYENRPFANYIIGSPTFWTPYFTAVPGYEKYSDEYGYFERNKTYDKNLFITAGDKEDEDYSEYYGDNDSTLEGVGHLKERLTPQ